MKLFIILFLLLCNNVFSQDKLSKFNVVFYNVENLFDTIDDPRTNDNAFLPTAPKEWNSKKYYEKLNNIAKVLVSIDSTHIPDIIGLCEVENENVLKDLLNTPLLKKYKYRIIHEDCSDPRGIDNALIYNSKTFKYLSHKLITVNYPSSKKNNREIMWVKGVAASKDTLDIFINHWKSRIGNEEATETKRVFYAMALKSVVDSMLLQNPYSNIIIMGDFNDEPTNKSIYDILRANNKRKNRDNTELFNLHYDLHNFMSVGTLVYNNSWFLFDQIIVSNNLLINLKGLHTQPEAGSIFGPEWILYNASKKEGLAPKPSYKGNNYIGGYSDHLPVFVSFFYNK